MKSLNSIVIASFLIVLCGCKTNDYTTSEERMTFSSFNDEEYVWEDFIFTTNRVESVK